jgi:SAM-dependent methyltransferase
MNMELFFEIHSGLPREGPGGDASTRKAFSLVPAPPASPKILDIGCGPGMQTRELARLSGRHVIGLDFHLPFLLRLKESAAAVGLSNRILCVGGSMTDLCFRAAAFDLIWAEGSIYIMGFAKGLGTWRRHLKPGGHIAVTEISWLKPDPPSELREFWEAGYPAIQDIAGNLQAIRECGLEPIGHFVLPESAWWDHYYRPLEERIAHLRRTYDACPEALELLDAETLEISLYRRFSAWYGYVFYIMKDPASG